MIVVPQPTKYRQGKKAKKQEQKQEEPESLKARASLEDIFSDRRAGIERRAQVSPKFAAKRKDERTRYDRRLKQSQHMQVPWWLLVNYKDHETTF